MKKNKNKISQDKTYAVSRRALSVGRWEVLSVEIVGGVASRLKIALQASTGRALFGIENSYV